MERFEPGDICLWIPKKPRHGFFGIKHPDATRPAEVVVNSGPSVRGEYLCEFINEEDRKKLMPPSGRLRIRGATLRKVTP